MLAGTFFLIVGASGVGKDTLLAGARAALATDERFVFARRTITRPADAGGEDHLFMAPEAFARTRQAGGFLSCWSAHGLDYGLPIALALGWLFVRRGSIYASIGLHATFNGFLLVLAEAATRAG